MIDVHHDDIGLAAVAEAISGEMTAGTIDDRAMRFQDRLQDGRRFGRAVNHQYATGSSHEQPSVVTANRQRERAPSVRPPSPPQPQSGPATGAGA